jgi:CheY-like chemotaxis protein
MGSSTVARSGPVRHAKLALLVDADADVRRAYAEFLQLNRWSIEEAADGPEALAKAISKQPDVIVTDTGLRGIDGLALCRLLREDSFTCGIPVVVTTGVGVSDEPGRARAAGARAVLVKPCAPDALLREIARVLAPPPRPPSRVIASGTAGRRPEGAGPAASRPPDGGPRSTLKKAHLRHTTATPPSPPPRLVCPSCDRPLIYQHSHIGGVSARHEEQWDYYVCGRECGAFQYRQRTRKLRKLGRES